MSLNLRNIGIGIGVVGIAVGVAFGFGVAYGQGDPKTVSEGLTAQQVQSLVGGGAANAAGGVAPGVGGASGTGAQAATSGTVSALLGGATVGRVTSVQGQTVTVQTAQGSVKLNLGSSTTVSKVSTGGASDLTEGAIIAATGTRKDDGSVDATSVSQVPTELQTLATGGTGTRPAASATPTP